MTTVVEGPELALPGPSLFPGSSCPSRARAGRRWSVDSGRASVISSLAQRAAPVPVTPRQARPDRKPTFGHGREPRRRKGGSMGFDPTVITQGVLAAYEREGYTGADGSRDMKGMPNRIFGVIESAKVLNKREREAKAITRGNVFAGVFPSFPLPDAWEDESDPGLTEEVYKKIDSEVWAELNPTSGRVQRLVGVNMGNGYVLCRTELGRDRVDAVYITDAREC